MVAKESGDGNIFKFNSRLDLVTLMVRGSFGKLSCLTKLMTRVSRGLMIIIKEIHGPTR